MGQRGTPSRCKRDAARTYTYHAQSRRVRKVAGGVTTEYLYDLANNVVAEQQGTTTRERAVPTQRESSREAQNGRLVRPPKATGFSLIEMLIVISVILILASISVPSYRYHVRRAHETALRQNLYTLRSTIQAFTLDKQRSPSSLDELVTVGYLGVLPRDITGQKDTWQVEYSDELISPDQPGPGVIDVRSGSADVATDGTPYNTW